MKWIIMYLITIFKYMLLFRSVKYDTGHILDYTFSLSEEATMAELIKPIFCAGD